MSTRADQFIALLDNGLRALFVPPGSNRPRPAAAGAAAPLTESERRHAAGLMRVNHVGEVCAQALYAAQALSTRDEHLRKVFVDAAREEGDHLAWTASRLDELGARTSLLNPLWYAGSFVLGYAAGRSGDAVSLGFVVETEKQVEEHLAGHLERLPKNDLESRAIVASMREDEIAHGDRAREAGAAEISPLVRTAMRGVARLMTSTAYWI